MANAWGVFGCVACALGRVVASSPMCAWSACLVTGKHIVFACAGRFLGVSCPLIFLG
ncbi:hypothetical protein [Helicobacter gastrocanis]|uniref:hypothetical protein n=1 Tax=Helicobacter gastrocanis TaxID=2849641 RepID=UPI001C8665E7|nr:hypothetical protein [Helicobacter sp. NHP19-003]